MYVCEIYVFVWVDLRGIKIVYHHPFAHTFTQEMWEKSSFWDNCRLFFPKVLKFIVYCGGNWREYNRSQHAEQNINSAHICVVHALYKSVDIWNWTDVSNMRSRNSISNWLVFLQNWQMKTNMVIFGSSKIYNINQSYEEMRRRCLDY